MYAHYPLVVNVTPKNRHVCVNIVSPIITLVIGTTHHNKEAAQVVIKVDGKPPR